ncbi:MAG: hypothetical protein M1835_003244 [Candelina submexicana]|nr:MAG: hypothetical protein M1835_003244 [Candelina submexicana]
MDGTILPRSHNDVVPHSTGFRTDCILGFNSSTTPDCCVAVIWAHASRIWGIRFLQHQQKKAGGSIDLVLISWGEDATCQQWAIRLTDNEGNAPCSTQYKHKATARIHSGKNIWSLGSSPGVCQYPLAATGGADGRISVFNPIAYHKTAFTAFLRKEWRIEEILAVCINGSNGSSKSLNTEAISTTSDDRPVYQDSNKLCIPSESLEPSKLAFAADGKANLGGIKGYAFLDERHLILSTSLGALIVGTLPSLPGTPPAPVENCIGGSAHDTGEVIWQMIDILGALKNYSLVVSVPQMGTALVTGANGVIYSYKHDSGKVSHLTSVDKKISGLFAQYLVADRFILLVTCVSCPVARLTWIHCENKMAQVENEYELRLLSDFVPTSMLCLQSRELLVLGARSGAMAVYDLSESQPGHNEAKVAVACFRRAHGEDAITIITNLLQPLTDTPSLGQYLLTAARDGRYSIHLLTAIRSPAGVMENVFLKTVHTSSPPFGPHIEGAYIDFDSHELVLYGFRGKDFVVWNESSYSEILTIECGGKHRSWAYSPRNGGGGGGGSLVWTKASSLNIFSAPRASHMVLRHGGHGREIKALAIHQRDGRRLSEKIQLLATGAEDTSIRIFELRDDKFNCIGVFKKHTTGVQQLEWSECGNFLFSCGGSEEFYVWRVRDVPVLKVGVVQEAACPPQSQLPDVRITNFQVSSIDQLGLSNSNSSHRFLVYSYLSSNNSGQFQMLYQGSYGSSCLTQVYQTTVKDKLSLFTAGTDGYIAYWGGLDEILTRASSFGDESSLTFPSQGRPPSSATWRCRFRVHQSTVKSMTVITLIDHSLLIVTGGDDNAVSITRVCFGRDEQELEPAHSTIRVTNAHASAVTATAALPSPSFTTSQYSGRVQLRFATASSDQRVKLWKVSVGLNRSDVGGLEISREATMRTSVADASSLGVVEESSELWKLVVCGVGMDVLSMSDK